MDKFTPITISRQSSMEERQAALYQIYKQVLERQPYGYERRMFAPAEKDFLKDKIGVRRFLKALGHSEIYLKSFYFNSSNLKFIEWCFKHFMGRAPQHQAEVQQYSDILMKKGAEALITAILDSEEYRKAFGCFTVPYPRQLSHYMSPRAYWESKVLNHEFVGQRGHIVPTIYWHELGLNCDAGVCRHLEANEDLASSDVANHLQDELLTMLRTMDLSEARKVVSSLSPQQKAALRRAIGA